MEWKKKKKKVLKMITFLKSFLIGDEVQFKIKYKSTTVRTANHWKNSKTNMKVFNSKLLARTRQDFVECPIKLLKFSNF